MKTLIKLNKPVILGNEKVHIDPTSLFSRLILIVERNSNIEYFQYELAQMPTALFTDYNMRKSNKSDFLFFIFLFFYLCIFIQDTNDPGLDFTLNTDYKQLYYRTKVLIIEFLQTIPADRTSGTLI